LTQQIIGKKQGNPYIPQQTLIKPTLSGECGTYGKLKKIEKLFKKYGLLNNKYLYKRDSIYYFSFRIGSQVVKKSFKTNNFLIANLLKYQIFIQFKNRLLEENMENDFRLLLRDELIVNSDKNGNFLNIIPENEAEKELLKQELVNTLVSKAKRLKIPITVNGNDNIKGRDTRKNLKQGYDLYVKNLQIQDTKEQTKQNNENNAAVIFYFLDDNTKIHNITKEDIKKIQLGLTNR